MGMMKRMLERRPVFEQLLERERTFVKRDDRPPVTDEDRARWRSVAGNCFALGWMEIADGFMELADGSHD
jgi:hypothetical protein